MLTVRERMVFYRLLPKCLFEKRCAVCSWFVTQKFLMLVRLGIANDNLQTSFAEDLCVQRWLHSSVRKF